MDECLNVSVQVTLKTFKDINLLVSSLLSIPFFNIAISFVLSFFTAKVSFNVFLVAKKLNIDSLPECLSKIGGMIKEVRYEKFVFEYCLTTALLVTAITNLQFKSDVSLHAVVMYSVLGPFIARDKLQDVLKEQKRTSGLEAESMIRATTIEEKEKIKKEQKDDYMKSLLDKIERYKEEKYK